MNQINAAFRGFTAPVKDLLDSIHSLGWTVDKVDLKGDEYRASAKNDKGDKLEAIGPTDNAALGHLLMNITRHDASEHRAKISKWERTWDDQIEVVAQAYAEAPVYDPKAVSAWKELSDDSKRRAEAIAKEIEIEMVVDPAPYRSIDEMIADVRDKSKIKISTASTEHPLWSSEEVLNFRLVHNVIGHCTAGGDWGWRGENLATAAHMSVLDPIAQKALFTETIGRSAFTSYYGVSVQKIAILDELIEDAQEKENVPGWGGTHPSQTVIPGKIPVVEKESSIKYASDPNDGWKSHVDPLPTNAYLWTRDIEGRDPLNLPQLRDYARSLDSRWTSLVNADGTPDIDSQRQAVANAFRAILLAPRKSFRDTVTHYQDIAHIAPSVDDPLRYWKALEAKRDEHNQGIGLPAGFHEDPWEEAVNKFRSWVKGLNPELNDEEVYDVADRQLFHMICEEEERIELDDKGNSSAGEIEQKAMKAVQQRLKKLVKPNFDEATDFGDELARFSATNPALYPPFMVNRLKNIAAVSHSLNEIYQAAMEDMSNGGSGHLFRSKVLNLDLPGIGPQESSYAWMLLAPKTSELAVIDDVLAELLGYKEQPSERDYFKLERQLAAGRDAAGYGHIPLGQFGWGLWNNRKFGQGNNADYTGIKVLSPRSRQTINWDEYPRFVDEWEEPDWWRETEEVRDMIGKHWDKTVAPIHPSDTIPKLSAFEEEEVDEFEGVEIPPYYPWFVDDLGQEQVGQPGMTLMRYLKDVLGLSTKEIWQLQTELGKRNG